MSKILFNEHQRRLLEKILMLTQSQTSKVIKKCPGY